MITLLRESQISSRCTRSRIFFCQLSSTCTRGCMEKSRKREKRRELAQAKSYWAIRRKKERTHKNTFVPPSPLSPEALDIVIVKEEEVRDLAHSIVIQYFNCLCGESEGSNLQSQIMLDSGLYTHHHLAQSPHFHCFNKEKCERGIQTHRHAPAC